MIPTLCAASLLPLHLYREGTHAESDTASPLFFRKPSEEMQPAASSLATHCNGQRSGLQRKGQRHERTAALIHYIYRSAEQRTNIQDRSAKFNIYRVSLPRRKSFKQAIRQKEARLVQNDWTVTNDSS